MPVDRFVAVDLRTADAAQLSSLEFVLLEALGEDLDRTSAAAGIVGQTYNHI